MSLLQPIALVGLAVPVVIYIIHWLFGTRRKVRVPAVFLWRDLPHTSSGRARRRLPPFSWLLLLQLLAATTLVFALSRPGVPSDPPRHVTLILDASGSMQATDVAPTRFEAARRAAMDRLATLGESDLVSVIRAGQTASLVATGAPATVRDALRTAEPGKTAPAIHDAVALAAARISTTAADHRGQIVLFTDGAWPSPDPVGALSTPLEVVPTGGGSDNQAIAQVVVRSDPSGLGQTAFVELWNASDASARVPMQIMGDGAPLDQRQVAMGPRSHADLSIPLPADVHHIVVQLQGKDALALDDVVEAYGPGGPARSVDLLGRVSDSLRRAIESVPSMHVRSSDDVKPADLSVLAGVLPAQLPPGPLLLVDPPANSARLSGVGLGSGARLQAAHPLLEGLDLAALQDEKPTVSGVPGWAHVVLGTQQGPLIMEGRLEGHPVVSLTFDPTLSGLEKSLAFPLLVSNATAFLMLEQANPGSALAGETFDAAESDIRPRAATAFQAPTQVPAEESSLPLRPADVWPWLAVGALALLSLEWLVFARRG